MLSIGAIVKSRTGMIVVPLICAVFDVSYEEAQRFVEESTRGHRPEDAAWPQYVHMPETDDQRQLAQALEGFVRKHRR